MKNYLGFRCGDCGRFVSNIKAEVNGLGDINNIFGDCKEHGRVIVTNTADWCYEYFFPEDYDYEVF